MRRSIVFAAILLITLAYGCVWTNAPIQGGDSRDYMDLALQLKNGTLKEPHDRVIGYPILLLLTASAEAPTRMLFWLSLLLHAITVSCLYVILRSIKAPFPLAALTCGILLLPPYVQTTAYVLTENAAEFKLAVTVTALNLWYAKQQQT